MPALFEYQLKLLELEISTINSSIRQMDDTLKNIKQWTVSLWTAAVGLTLATPALHDYIQVTGLIPLLFLFVELSFRRIQRRFIWRSERIGHFINDGGLARAFELNRISDFRLWDPSGVYSADESYRRFISFRTLVRFPDSGIFFLGLAFASLLIAAF